MLENIWGHTAQWKREKYMRMCSKNMAFVNPSYSQKQNIGFSHLKICLYTCSNFCHRDFNVSLVLNEKVGIPLRGVCVLWEQCSGDLFSITVLLYFFFFASRYCLSSQTLNSDFESMVTLWGTDFFFFFFKQWLAPGQELNDPFKTYCAALSFFSWKLLPTCLSLLPKCHFDGWWIWTLSSETKNLDQLLSFSVCCYCCFSFIYITLERKGYRILTFGRECWVSFLSS